MSDVKSWVQGAVVLALMGASTACVVEPRNDYWDRDHHRYYHEHAWHECGDHDDHCR
jgi:hypothetical protein